MIRWFARNSYAANFLMLAILLAGAYAAKFQIPTEVTPSFRFSLIVVNIALPGGTPSEVEQKIVFPVENALQGIVEVKSMRAFALRGRGEFRIEVKDGVDMDKLRACLLYTSPSPRDKRQSRMPSSA